MNLKRHIPLWLAAWGTGLALLAAGLIIAGTQPVHSAEKSGAYASVGAGWSRLGDVETNWTDDDFHNQWSATGAFGYAWPSGLALELLGEYGRYGGDGNFDPFGAGATAGILTITPCAVYTLGTALTIDPYGGVCIGMGYAGLDPDGRDAFPNAEADNFNSADLGWAWKLRGGLTLKLVDSGRFRLNTEYRYTCLEGISFTGAGPDHTDHLCTHGAGAAVLTYF